MDALALLTEGDIVVEGRMPWSSNATFLVHLCRDGEEGRAIYKPTKGERPLWDFPTGLHRREVAAYQLSEVLGYHVVPPTVLRHGPLGEGSLQWFVAADFEQHYFTMYEQFEHLHPQLQAIAVFDILANNTDRKSGHCLLDKAGKVWGIDHGLCFAADFKLRTVIWEFGGGQIDEALLAPVRRIAESVPAEVADVLDDADEVEALRVRAALLADRPVFPVDASGRRYPWPLV